MSDGKPSAPRGKELARLREAARTQKLAAHLLDHRFDPDARGVLNDWRAERGIREERLGSILLIATATAAATTAAADADAATAATAATADAAATAADADATTAATAADAADATTATTTDDAAATTATARKSLHQLLTEEPDMRNGLKVLQLTGSYYGYAVTFVGWVRRLSGDEYELLPGAVTVARVGEYNQNGLAQLAAKGPGRRYRVSEPSEAREEIHRLLVRRSIPATEKPWAEICPKPKDWRDE